MDEAARFPRDFFLHSWNVDEVYRHKIKVDLRHNIHDVFVTCIERQEHKAYHLVQLDNVHDEMTRIPADTGYNHHDHALDCFVYLEEISKSGLRVRRWICCYYRACHKRLSPEGPSSSG